MDSPSKPLSSPINLSSETQAARAAAGRPRTVSTSSQDSADTFTQDRDRSSPFVPPRRLYAQPNLNASSSSIQSFSRPLPRQQPAAGDRAGAKSPTETIGGGGGSGWVPGHRARQRSQGFFDPTVSSSSINNSATAAGSGGQQNMAGLSASQIAAQAAMHVQGRGMPVDNAHNRKRSQTLPDPSAPAPSPQGVAARRPPPVQPTPYGQPQQTPMQSAMTSRGGQYGDGFLGGHSLVAATAANAAFPRSPGQAPQPHPHTQAQWSPQLPLEPPNRPPPVPEKDAKPGKEKSKMKLFSKPKNIGIYKGDDKKLAAALPSPRLGGYGGSTTTVNKFGNINASTTSLVDPSIASSNSSFYSAQNASTSTLVPADREREREKHKHHFLSRQKNKLKDKDDLHLALSSASSTSRPVDPTGPQPLYNFAVPASPGHASTFAKSVSGLDLRHGGRALREKKKEDKLQPTISNNSLLEPPPRDASLPQNSDWPNPSPYSSTSQFGPATGGTVASSHPSDYGLSQPIVANLGNSFGIQGMQRDDAWPLLKAKLLSIFEGEDLRPPIEDFNSLVSVHLKTCIQRRAPNLIIEDLNELLQTGFLSLDQTLRGIPDDRLVPHLVAMWMMVFTVVLPFLQAVFLPLDLEFKGRGPIMNSREAADFWGAALPSPPNETETADGEPRTSTSGSTNRNMGEELDVRRIILLKFRDTVFLPRHEALMAIFTRLSLDSISAGIYPYDPLPEPPSIGGGGGGGSRPGTANSADARFADGYHASYNSQSSTLLDSGSPFSSAAGRSRATSNTSAGSFPSSIGHHSNHSNPLNHFPQMPPQPQPMDSAQVTEMVGRMLQCVSVLASVQSGDEGQRKMERLVKELKLNWLGRGRTGRQRRGFVGTRLRTVPSNTATA